MASVTISKRSKMTGLADDYAAAIFQIQQAIIREPLYAAGHGTVVSKLNQVTQGTVLAKTGAEGVLTAALISAFATNSRFKPTKSIMGFSLLFWANLFGISLSYSNGCIV
jgi:hypothetical protein